MNTNSRTKFHINYVATSQTKVIYADFIQVLQSTLQDLGYECSVAENQLIPSAVNILVGSTIFASRFQSLPQALQGLVYVVYQLEQLDDEHGLLTQWPEYWQLLQNAALILDYSPTSTQYLQQKGLGAKTVHLPPGFHRGLERFGPHSEADKDIDVLFFGSSHPRRLAIIEALKKRGLQVIHCDFMVGKPLDDLVSRSKVVLNIHAWDNIPYLETIRLAYLLANQSFVISEEADHNPYGDGIVFSPYTQIVEQTGHYLQQPDTVRRKIAQQGQQIFRSIELAPLLEKLLAQTSLSSLVFEHEKPIHFPGSGSDFLPINEEMLVDLVSIEAQNILHICPQTGFLARALKARHPCMIHGLFNHDILGEYDFSSFNELRYDDVIPSLEYYPDATFDSIIITGALEQEKETDRLLLLAHQKLRQNGSLIVSVFNAQHWSILSSCLNSDWNYQENSGIFSTHNIRLFTRNSLFLAIKKNGFIPEAEAATTVPDRQGIATALINAISNSGVSCPNPDLLNTFQFILTCKRR